MAQDEEVKRIEISDALQDVLVMQPAVMVGLISMMTGSALQEDIAATSHIRRIRHPMKDDVGSSAARRLPPKEKTLAPARSTGATAP